MSAATFFRVQKNSGSISASAQLVPRGHALVAKKKSPLRPNSEQISSLYVRNNISRDEKIKGSNSAPAQLVLQSLTFLVFHLKNLICAVFYDIN